MKGIAVALLTALASVGGAQEAVYEVRGAQLPVPAAVNGYQQSVVAAGPDTVRVEVVTSLHPIRSRGGSTDAGARGMLDVPADFRLPRGLLETTRSAGSAWELATRVLEWVMTEVRIDPDDIDPQDAASVLERRRGRCSGMANAAAALLLSHGLEARTVSGLLVGEEGLVPHRWVECRLPGAGWVPTDPTLGLWVITPRHLVFSNPVHDLPDVRLLSSSPGDPGSLARRGGRLIRLNQGADLICRLVGTEAGALAVLHGPGGEARRAWLAPEGRFAGLSPGAWLLVVRRGGEVVARRRLQLEEGSVHSVAVSLPAEDEVGS